MDRCSCVCLPRCFRLALLQRHRGFCCAVEVRSPGNLAGSFARCAFARMCLRCWLACSLPCASPGEAGRLHRGRGLRTEKDACMQVCKQMANVHRQTNLYSSSIVVHPNPTAVDEESRPLMFEELRVELLKRERMMQEGAAPDGTATDRWRVYSEAIVVLSSNEKPLRLVLQATCTRVLCTGSVLSASTARASWTPRTRKTKAPNGWRA